MFVLALLDARSVLFRYVSSRNTSPNGVVLVFFTGLHVCSVVAVPFVVHLLQQAPSAAKIELLSARGTWSCVGHGGVGLSRQSSSIIVRGRRCCSVVVHSSAGRGDCRSTPSSGAAPPQKNRGACVGVSSRRLVMVRFWNRQGFC